jgi:hypothetical protein
MAMHGEKPFVHVSDANGAPYVGAKLYVYEVTTTTLRSIYSDEGLSVAIANPLTSDAAGNFDRFYQAAGTYKLTCETSAGVPIWEEDNIDTGLPAGTGALPISRGGTGATTAAAARAALDVPSNSELSDLADDISDLSDQIQNVISIPQGRLTLTILTPVLAADVSASTAVYYTPYTGNLVPIWNGTTYVITEFAELTLSLNSNHVASNIYDTFVINDAGTVRLVSGPAWNSAAAGSGSRGTGAGTTELERVNGLWVNKNDMTARYGATTVAVDARKGTFVGSMFIDGTNGQATCHVAIGQNRKWAISNAYWREPITLKSTDATATWTYDTNTYRQSNAATGNKVTIFSCLPEESYSVDFRQNVTTLTSVSGGARIGIGVNATASASGFSGQADADGSAQIGTLTAFHDGVPFIGINNINMLETVPAASSCTFAGTEAHCRMTARWRG